jgi:hypothetical protein
MIGGCYHYQQLYRATTSWAVGIMMKIENKQRVNIMDNNKIFSNVSSERVISREEISSFSGGKFVT